MLGTSLPLLLAFDLGGQALPALALGAGLLAVLAILSATKKTRKRP